MDYWRVQFTGGTGESANVSVKLDGNEVFPETDYSLLLPVIIVGHPHGTVAAHAARNDAGQTGELKAEIFFQTTSLAVDTDTGATAVVDCTATR